MNNKYKKENDINFFKCQLFRLAQVKWKKTKIECLDIFTKNKIFKYIEDCYEFIHMQSLQTSLKDIEKIVYEK